MGLVHLQAHLKLKLLDHLVTLELSLDVDASLKNMFTLAVRLKTSLSLTMKHHTTLYGGPPTNIRTTTTPLAKKLGKLLTNWLRKNFLTNASSL